MLKLYIVEHVLGNTFHSHYKLFNVFRTVDRPFSLKEGGGALSCVDGRETIFL